MEKVKKGFFLVLPLILGLYQLYLINRIWHYGRKASLIIGLFLIAMLYIVFYLFYKKINYKQIVKKKLIIITIISIILSIIILIFNFNFFAKKYRATSVYLYRDNIDTTQESNIPIKSIIVDNVVQTVDDASKKSPVELTFNNCKNITIVLEKNQTNGSIYIQDGEKQKQIDLYSYVDNVYTYKVTSNSIMSLFSIARAIISFVMIEILTLMICVSIYVLYKEKKSLLLPMLLLIALIQIAFYQQNTAYTNFPDTSAYENTWSKEQILSGLVEGRTPIYPLLIRGLKLIFGTDLWRVFIVKTQIITSFISIIFLYKTLKLLIKSEWLIAIITFLYGISGAIIGWNTCLLTESLALSGTIFMAYLVIYYIKNKKILYGVFSAILAFFITFLKPACISYIALLFAFLLLQLLLEKNKKPKNFICIGVSLLTIILTLCYAIVFYYQRNLFSITDARVRQDMYICMHQGFYKNTNDEEFIKNVDESIKSHSDNTWEATRYILNSYPYSTGRSQELIKICKKESKKEYREYLLNVINSEITEKFDAYNTLCINDVQNLTNNIIKGFTFLNFLMVFVIVIIEAILTIYRWIKNKEPNWINLGLFGFLVAILYTSFVGTNAEFMRTAICVVPFSYIAIGTLINDFMEKYKNK